MNGICKNCGATDGLHHFETNQCPVGGVEAPVGREQLWMKTTFEAENNEVEELKNTVNKLLTRIEALENQVKALQSETELQESVRIWGAT